MLSFSPARYHHAVLMPAIQLKIETESQQRISIECVIRMTAAAICSNGHYENVKKLLINTI